MFIFLEVFLLLIKKLSFHLLLWVCNPNPFYQIVYFQNQMSLKSVSKNVNLLANIEWQHWKGEVFNEWLTVLFKSPGGPTATTMYIIVGTLTWDCG